MFLLFLRVFYSPSRHHHHRYSKSRSRSRSYHHSYRRDSRDRSSRRYSESSSPRRSSRSDSSRDRSSRSYSESSSPRRSSRYDSSRDYDDYQSKAYVFLLVVLCSVDTHRYNRAASGQYNSNFSSGFGGYNNYDSFAGANLKDIQWDVSGLIKFEKNFYHVYNSFQTHY